MYLHESAQDGVEHVNTANLLKRGFSYVQRVASHLIKGAKFHKREPAKSEEATRDKPDLRCHGSGLCRVQQTPASSLCWARNQRGSLHTRWIGTSLPRCQSFQRLLPARGRRCTFAQAQRRLKSSTSGWQNLCCTSVCRARREGRTS